MTRLPIFCLALASLLVSSHLAWAAPIKACDLMTMQTAASVVGATVGAGREETLPMAAQQCIFTHDDPAWQASISIGLSDVNAMAAALRSDIAGVTRFFKSQAGKNAETIPSLGEWNSYEWNGLMDYTLTVIYHGKVLVVVASLSKNPNLKAAIVQAMRQAMQEL
jgi:hypothetical protein